MRKLVINEFSTLDGVMQAPGGPDEDRSADFDYGGWTVHYWDDGMGEAMSNFMEIPFDLLLGRKTYEIFAAHWPYSDEEPAATQLNTAKKYVASRTLDRVDWNNSNLLKGDTVEEVRKLKAQDGPELQVFGSSNFIQTLLQHNLIDEYRIWIFPVVIGKGKRLFDFGTIPAGLKLINSQAFSSGVILATYAPAGELVTGSFALENPTEAEIARREHLAKEG